MSKQPHGRKKSCVWVRACVPYGNLSSSVSQSNAKSSQNNTYVVFLITSNAALPRINKNHICYKYARMK